MKKDGCYLDRPLSTTASVPVRLVKGVSLFQEVSVHCHLKQGGAAFLGFPLWKHLK